MSFIRIISHLSRQALRQVHRLPGLVWLLCSLSLPPVIQAGGTEQIFVLHSYSQEYPWTRRQHEGFIHGMKGHSTTAPLFSIEYLDTKRHGYTADYRQRLSDHIAYKYAGYLPDLIYVTDDNALDFALSQLDRIFPDVPVIFSGVNNYHVLDEPGIDHVTGVFEKKNIVPNIGILQDSGMAVERIVFIGDGSNTYQAIANEVRISLEMYPSIEPVFVAAPDIDTIQAMLQKQQPGVVILTTLGAVKDNAGRRLPLNETISRVVAAGDFVILTMEDVYMHDGVLGGFVTSGRHQGQEAAELARRVLAGTAVQALSPITDSPNAYLFDHRELVRHGLELPPAIRDAATILHRPPSLYKRYRTYILMVLAGLTVLLVVTLATAYWLVKRKNIEIEQHAVNLDEQRVKTVMIKESLQEAQQIANMGNWDWDIKSDTLFWSDGIYELFGLQKYTFEPSYEAFLNCVHPDDRELLSEVVNHSLESWEPYDIQHRIVTPDGTIKFVHERGNAEYDEDGNPIRMIGTVQDITAERDAEEQLRDLATVDTLTRLPNRNTLMDRLDHAIQRARRGREQLALLFLDLDRFKQINDSLGHTVGDKLLVQAAERLNALVRSDDTVARLGGDEFIVLLEQLDDPGDAGIVAEKIIEVFDESFQIDDYTLFVTTSIGVSIYPDDGEDETTLLKHADAAMYHAKDTGRNSYSFYTEEITQRVATRVQLEHRMRDALINEAFELYLQPIYGLGNQRIRAMEVLLRWNDEKLGMVSPADFIPVAEDSGIIVQLGAWVMRRACETIQRWDQQGLLGDNIRININVSGVQLLQRDFVEQVKHVLRDTGARPDRLVIEMTEGVLLENQEDSIATLNQLVALGIEIAIDDFGTGYSSLSYLKAMPISTIKLDKSFVADLSHDENDRAIARAIIALGQSLDLKVVAEGIETQEQEQFLHDNGCTCGQGFMFQRPIPADEFESMLRDSARGTDACESRRIKGSDHLISS